MNFFGIGLPEMAVIAAIGLLVFGPKRLPELGRTLGRTLKGFQSASSEFEKEFRTAISTAEATTAQNTTAEVMVAELPSVEAASVSAAPVPGTEPAEASSDTSAD
jgi:sec-independent protein translocase protein TatA